jgi:G3E family GTPase
LSAQLPTTHRLCQTEDRPIQESPAAAASQRFPVSLLTGFLGSGKTTVLKRVVDHPDMARTVAIINEFGEVGLDHELVESAAEDMILLQRGCLCCSIRGDLIDRLRSLFMRRARSEISQFDRVVIETTGLADPAPSCTH